MRLGLRRRRLFGRARGAAAVLGLGLAARELLRRGLAWDLHDQVVLITGGSRGLGFLLAEEFIAQGARVAICARDQAELQAARAKLAQGGADVLAVPCDVTQQDQVRRLVEQTTAHFGRIDILVNNAGVITVGPFQSQTLEDYERSMQIMFWGMVYASLAVLPQMQQRGRGRIVNITSIGGKVAVPHLLPYSCAKFAAVGFSEGLAAEVAKDGVAVVTVAPGLMRTGSHVNARFKGRNQLEYAWFTLVGSLPFSSIAGRSAAEQIVQAARRGEPEVILSPQAQLLARLHGLAPGVIVDLMGLVNRLLPGPGGIGQESRSGKESQTPLTRRLLRPFGQADPKGTNE